MPAWAEVGGIASSLCLNPPPLQQNLDLISYLRAIPDRRMRRGVRFPALYLLLVSAQQQSADGGGRTARRQRQAQQDQEARRQRESQRDARQSWGDSQQNSRQADRNPEAGPDRQRAEALILLELSHGASLAAVKAAHLRLVKCHHPDMGGAAEAFRRINSAYQLLIA